LLSKIANRSLLTEVVLRFNMTFVSALICGILLFSLYGIKTPPAIISFSILYGISSGGLISLQSACVAQITPDTRTIGIRIGIMMAICSFGYVQFNLASIMRNLDIFYSTNSPCFRALTGSPIGGALIVRDSGGFTGLINFSAIILIGGAALVLCSRILAVPKFCAF